MIGKVSGKNMLKSIVPISRFNKGEANKIFYEVKTEGHKIVVKNNKPECVLIAPAEYEVIMETLENYYLLTQAEERVASSKKSDYVSQEQIMKEFNVKEEDLEDLDLDDT